MASELKVDKFTGVTTAGSILVTGEGNSTTTNLQQGLVKAWGNINGVTTTVLNDNFNHSSITDVNIGRTTMTFTNNMSSANYSVTTGCGLNGDSVFGGDLGASSLVLGASHRIQCRDQGGTFTDPDIATSQVTGDLA